MRLLGLLFALGLAWASPLEEALFTFSPIEGIRILLPKASPLTFPWPTWEEPTFALRLKPLYFRLREVWRGAP